jgi:predicted kinase
VGPGADFGTIIEGLRRTCEEGVRKSGGLQGWTQLLDRLDGTCKTHAALIDKRRAAGKVRRVHGDLHLRNLCVFDGKVIAFDAIEFDERMAATDVLYDFAFLLMDLRHMGLVPQANAALNRYWDETGEDEGALGLLPFLMALRAAVRMAVALEGGTRSEGAAYLKLGQDLLLPQACPAVALGGLSGTGKSTVAKLLAPMLPGAAGARILRSDVLRKKLLGLDRQSRAGAVAYTDAARESVYDVLAEAALAAAPGASVILDATFQSARSRSLVSSRFAGRLRAYWLTAPSSTRLERVAGRASDVSDADVDVAARQSEPALLEPAWQRVDANRPADETARAILADLGLAAQR